MPCHLPPGGRLKYNPTAVHPKICVILSEDLVREAKQVEVEPAGRAAPERRDPHMATMFVRTHPYGRPQVSPTGLKETLVSSSRRLLPSRRRTRACRATVSLRLGHASALTVHWTVIHYLGAASLPPGGRLIYTPMATDETCGFAQTISHSRTHPLHSFHVLTDR